jgi:hypothetical protein
MVKYVIQKLCDVIKYKILIQTINDKLFFYSKSRDVAVGKGANEIVAI